MPAKTKEPQSRIEKPEEKPVDVSLTRAEWVAVTQLLSVGIRQADDSVLEIGGKLLRQIKTQLQPPDTNGKG